MRAAAMPCNCWCAIARASASKAPRSGWRSKRHGPAAPIRAAMTGSALRIRCAARLIRVLLRSMLALRAEIARALALRDLPDRRAAGAAGAAIALIDIEPLAKSARVALGAHVIAQCRATGANRPLQRGAYRAHQARAFLQRQAPRHAPRMDTRAKQRLARVDVADTGDEPPVHQYLFYRGPPRARDAPEICSTERFIEWLGRERAQQPMLRGILTRVMQAAETARIVEAQVQRGLEREVELIVLETRRIDGQQAQAAGH